MSATAFWRRLDLSGRDAATLDQVSAGYALSGQAVFLDPRGPAALRYRLDLAPDWSTIAGRVEGFIGQRPIDTRVVRTDCGWIVNGRNFGMAEIVDLDLGFTPATNMPQLRRIALSIGDKASFDVAWLDAGSDEVAPLPQHYRRISDREYAYRSPTVDYEATVSLAETGFVASYPDLWEIEA